MKQYRILLPHIACFEDVKIFDPYPTVFDPLDSEKLILSPSKKDFATLKNILAKFPSIEELTMAQVHT